jgi:hypothetical protein
MKRMGLLFPACVLVAGCGDGRGETCGRATDCQGGLLCVDGGCAQVASTDIGGVYADPVTRLQWQMRPTSGPVDWESAVMHCESLELSGTGWRLPSVDELRTLIRGCPATESGGPCAATNACLTYDLCLSDCTGCEPDAGPAAGCYWPDELEGSCSWYWTASSLDDAIGAWYVVFNLGHVCGRSKDFNFGLVRCVR